MTGTRSQRWFEAMRWAFPLTPAKDELLSSFLVRAAHLHGLTPQRFCAYHFRGVEIWTRDIDRSASEALLCLVSTQAGLPIATVEQMTLRGFESAIAIQPRQGIAPWINAIGVHHRLRRRWGLQYCPDCLAEQAYFRRAWRLSFVTICETHGSLLCDDCPHCHAPLAPHRQSIALDHCHVCSRPLADASGREVREAEQRQLIDIQRKYFTAIHYGATTLFSLMLSARDLLLGIHIVTSAFAGRGPGFQDDVACQRKREALELTRSADRIDLLLWQRRILLRWPRVFLKAAALAHLTQRSFVQWALPVWLAKAVLLLPEGRARSRISDRSPLRCQAPQARHRKDALWRTAHAESLLRAIRR